MHRSTLLRTFDVNSHPFVFYAFLRTATAALKLDAASVLQPHENVNYPCGLECGSESDEDRFCACQAACGQTAPKRTDCRLAEREE